MIFPNDRDSAPKLKGYFMKHIIPTIISVIFLVSCAKDKSIDTTQIDGSENLIDSVSYALGLDIASRLELEYEKLNYKMLNKGIEDHVVGNEFSLTDAERELVIKRYSSEIVPKYRMELEKKNMREGRIFLEENLKKSGVIKHRSGVQYKIIKDAVGGKPKPSDLVRIHYVGKLIDGTTFDSSYSRGEPAVFPVNRVVPGFSQGIQLMSPGAKYQLFIPGPLGYGQGDGPGGPMAVMIFQVELLEILSAPKE
jgi:FKBP-type peptidyl-prolyl cis-trans isomerase